MTEDDVTPARDVEEVRRTLRIERAVVAAVLHGHGRDNWGFNDAMTALLSQEKATLIEVVTPLWWALARLPRGLGEPDELLARLTALYGVGDD